MSVFAPLFHLTIWENHLTRKKWKWGLVGRIIFHPCWNVANEIAEAVLQNGRKGFWRARKKNETSSFTARSWTFSPVLWDVFLLLLVLSFYWRAVDPWCNLNHFLSVCKKRWLASTNRCSLENSMCSFKSRCK